MSKGNTLLSVAQRAKATFERNIDTIVAAFLIRHPDVDPAEVEMVVTPGEDRALHFNLQKKGGVVLPETKPEVATDGEFDQGYARGWNVCRAKIEELNKLPLGAMVQTVAEQHGIEDAKVVDSTATVAESVE